MRPNLSLKSHHGDPDRARYDGDPRRLQQAADLPAAAPVQSVEVTAPAPATVSVAAAYDAPST